MLKKKEFKSRNKYYKPKPIGVKRVKTFLKSNPSFIKPKFHKIVKACLKPINYSVIIKVTPNNIFCLLKDSKNRTLVLVTAGILHLRITKKKLKFAGKILIADFIEKIEAIVKNKVCFISVSAPIKTRKHALKQIMSSLKKSQMLVVSIDKKIFNGCRAKKKRRKKRKGLRVFK